MRTVIELLEPRRLLATVSPGFNDQPWGGTISFGTSMVFAPDGRLFVATQLGDVRIINGDGNLLPEPALTLQVAAGSEAGLLGIALDPAFESNGYIYLHFSNRFPAVSQIARFVMTGDTIDPASRTDIFQLGSRFAFHQGGAIHFGADGMLYIGRGDNADAASAQRIDNFYGKFLRINPAAYDPSDPLAVIPPDNPTSFPGITGEPTGAHRAIWAVGLRNPFTFGVHPTDGRIMINDVGAGGFEEINHGLAGRNYGWPGTEGGFDPAQFPDFTPPLYYYDRGVFGGTTIAGGAFYVSSAPGAFPAHYQGKYFFADFGSGWIGYLDPDAPPTTHSTHTYFASGVGAVVDLDIGPDGALYYLRRAASTGGVYRITAVPSTPPTAMIHLPARYSAGDTVQFAGSAADPDQPAFHPRAFSWTVDFHYEGQIQPVLGPIDGTVGGTFGVPRAGVMSLDQFYRVHLTVTDDSGLQTSTVRDIHPNIVNLTLQTFPGNTTLYYDGQPYPTPLTVQSIVGYLRTLGAPSNHFHNGQWLQFFAWSDGSTDRVREIFAPLTERTYIAVYGADTAPPGVTSSRFDYDGVLLPDAPHRIRFEFSEDVSASLATEDLVLVNTTTGQTIPAAHLALDWDPIANVATFTYTGHAQRILPDGSYTATLLAAGISDPPGHPLAGNHVLSFRVLAGDANGDGVVNLRDFTILAANFRQTARQFSQGNFNYDDVVDGADLNILAGRFGQVLAPPAPPPSSGVAPLAEETDELSALLA